LFFIKAPLNDCLYNINEGFVLHDLAPSQPTDCKTAIDRNSIIFLYIISRFSNKINRNKNFSTFLLIIYYIGVQKQRFLGILHSAFYAFHRSKVNRFIGKIHKILTKSSFQSIKIKQYT